MTHAVRPTPRRTFFRRLWRSQDGASTLPAVFFLPVFLMIMAASVEMCVMILKQTMLDRGVDLSTRILRLGPDKMPTHDELKRSICTNIAYLHNCMDELAVEVLEIDKASWTTSGTGKNIVCADKSTSEPVAPTLEAGASNQMMLVRACLKVDTMMEMNPLAMAMVKDAAGQYALVAVTAFVNEPRATGATTTGGS